MAITKKLIHFNEFSNFNVQKLSANRENTSYTIGVGGTVTDGEPYILYHSIVFIKDVLKIWTHGSLYDCSEADLSGYLTAEEIAEVYATIESLATKQDKVLKFENVAASSWVSDATYTDFPFRCDMACEGVTSDNYAEVVFALEQATGGNYAPLCATGAGIVSIWSASDTTITVPTVIITI